MIGKEEFAHLPKLFGLIARPRWYITHMNI